MKTLRSMLLTTLTALISFIAAAQQYKVVTIVESIVPMGVGRSRIIEENQDVDVEAATKERTDGTKSNVASVSRESLKVDNFAETKLLNFYSAAGINFQNIASNDAAISAKLTDLGQKGWQVIAVTSGVDSGGQRSGGLFITRIWLKKV